MMAIPRVSPTDSILAVCGQILATAWVEIVMQWRRWGFWVTLAGYTALMLLLTVQSAIYMAHFPPTSPYVNMHLAPTQLYYLMIMRVAL